MKKENQRRPYMKNLVLAFVLAIIIFVATFLLGYTISYSKYQGVVQSQEQFRYNLLSFEVEKTFLKDSCDNFNPYLFAFEMEEMGKTINVLETRLGKNNQRILEQKKIYALLEAQHFLYVKEHNSQCNNTVQTILFFYSNQGEYKDRSEDVGFMLSMLKNKKEDLMIYSFDYDLDSSLILLLKEKYKINRPLSLVVNEQNIITSLESIENIEKQLN